jgi:hypothetical protein
MSDLAERILQPRSSVTRIVDGLERRGLVRGERTSADARGAGAVTTDAGLAVSRRAQRSHHDNVPAVFLDRLSEDQLHQLRVAWVAVRPQALTPAQDETERDPGHTGAESQQGARNEGPLLTAVRRAGSGDQSLAARRTVASPGPQARIPPRRGHATERTA